MEQAQKEDNNAPEVPLTEEENVLAEYGDVYKRQMDEFANVSLPDDFDKILSVMRSRGVSVSIILQHLAQLKACLLYTSRCV